MDAPTLLLCAWMGISLATSPLPLAALAVMLLSDRAGRCAAVFTVTWFVQNVVAIAIFVPLVRGALNIQKTAGEKHIIGWTGLVLGCLILALGVGLWFRSRGKTDTKSAARAKALLDRAAQADTRQAITLGIIFGFLNITNYGCWLATAFLIDRAHYDFCAPAATIAMTSIIASSTFAIISIITVVKGDKVKPKIVRARDFVEKHATSIAPGLLSGVGCLLILVGLNDLGVF